MLSPIPTLNPSLKEEEYSKLEPNEFESKNNLVKVNKNVIWTFRQLGKSGFYLRLLCSLWRFPNSLSKLMTVFICFVNQVKFWSKLCSQVSPNIRHILKQCISKPAPKEFDSWLEPSPTDTLRTIFISLQQH